MSWAEVKYAINSTLGTDKFASIDKLIGGYEIFTEDGTFIVPENVHEIFVTGCGGGQSGQGRYDDNSSSGNGGNGADFIYNKRYSVTPNQQIEITIGKGGAAAPRDSNSQNNGASTIIGDFVTLPGGSSSSENVGGSGDGSGSNIPGASYISYLLTGASMSGSNGNKWSNGRLNSGGPGAGSLGRGGQIMSDTDGAKGGYGAGGSGANQRSVTYTSGAGGDGIVIITWGNFDLLNLMLGLI